MLPDGSVHTPVTLPLSKAKNSLSSTRTYPILPRLETKPCGYLLSLLYLDRMKLLDELVELEELYPSELELLDELNRSELELLELEILEELEELRLVDDELEELN